jgi:hypothetical protein
MNERQSLLKDPALYRFFAGSAPLIILGCIWIIVQAIIFYQYGIVTDFEAKKYINEAGNLLQNGTVSTPNFWLYSSQIFLIAAAMKLKTGFLSVVIVQLFFNGLATYIFFKFVSKTSNRITAIIITLFLICNHPLQTFNTSLQTESLFYSLTLLFSCYLLQLKELTFRNFAFILLFIVLISFTRPTGLFFIPATAVYIVFRFFRHFSILSKLFIIAISCIVFFYFLNIAIGSGGELDFMLPFRDENIICGVPSIPYEKDIKISSNPNSLFGLLYYITHNFEQFIRLAWLRSKAFFGLFRSYYSVGHNLYLGLYFFPFYFLLVTSIRAWIKRNKYLLLYCISLIIITWGSVILACDDWHNRFYLSIVPFIYILSVPAVQKIAMRFSGKYNAHHK